MKKEFWLIFLLCVSFVLAQEICDPNIQTCPEDIPQVPQVDPLDPSNPNSYSDADFYSKVSPSKWDWSLVQWNQVDLSRDDLYSYSGFYNNLPRSEHSNINYNQVDYTKIRQNKIDSSKFFIDKGCISCKLDRRGFRAGADFLFRNRGIEHPDTGTFITASSYPGGTKFYVTEKKGIVTNLHEAIRGTKIDIQTDDVTTFDVEETGAAPEGELKVNGVSVDRGQLSVDENGQTYIDQGTQLVTEGVSITNVQTKTNIYADGRRHDDANYVSVGGKGKKVYARSTGPKVNNKEDAISQSLQINLPGQVLVKILNSELFYQDRSERGLIPQLKFNTNKEDGWLFLRNGQRILAYNSVTGRVSSGRGNGVMSSPISVLFHDENDRNLLSKSSRIIFDARNNKIGITEETFQELGEEKLECTDCAQNFADLQYAVSNVFLREIPTSYGFNIRIPSGANPQIIANLNNLIAELPPALRSSIRDLVVMSTREDVVKACGGISYSGACAKGSHDRIILDGNNINKQLFFHEVAHLATFGTFGNLEFRNELNQFKISLLEKYSTNLGGLGRLFKDNTLKFGTEEYNQELGLEEIKLNEMAVKLTSNPFTRNWEQIASRGAPVDSTGETKPIYGTARIVNGKLSWDNDNNPVKPQYGCVRAYGCTSREEDIATFVGTVQNPNYDWGEVLNSDLREVYIGKLKLLRNEGFISEADYDRVMSNAFVWNQ